MTVQPLNPDFRSFVQDYVAAQGFLALLGVQVIEIEPGRVGYRVPFRTELGQQNGVFHGGVIGGIAEAVMGAAAATLAPTGGNVMGAEYKINLLIPARGVALVAHGHVLKSGRRLVVCRADVLVEGENEHNKLCAVAQGAMVVVQP